MKIIKLYAYLENNLGDDLMINILLNRYKNYRFYYCDEWERSDVFLKYKNFFTFKIIEQKFKSVNNFFNLFLPKSKKNYLINYISNYIDKHTICSVYIGGSIFMQHGDVRYGYGNILRDKLKRLNDGKLFIIGASFGPYFQEEYLEIYRKFFSKCRGVTFRDYHSFNLFKDLKQVKYASDVVFALKNNNQQNENVVDKQVVISIVNFETKDYYDDYKKFIKNFCIEVANRNKYPVLVSFCKYEGDEKAVSDIYDTLPETVKSITKKIFYSEDNIDVLLKLFQRCCFVLATRFHSMILALKFNKPFFAISYAPKVSDYLNDLNFDCYCNLSEIKKIKAKDVFDYYFLSVKTENIQLYSEKAFLQLDTFLTGRLL